MVKETVDANVKDEIDCVVCMGYIQLTGVQCCLCDKILCKMCYDKLVTTDQNQLCPACREEGSELTNHKPFGRIFKNILKSIKFTCQGCKNMFNEE